MKDILKVTILFCLFILFSTLFCFATDNWANSKLAFTSEAPESFASMTNVLVNGGANHIVSGYASSNYSDCYVFVVFDNNSYPTVYGVSVSSMKCWYAYDPDTSTTINSRNSQYNRDNNLYFCNMNLGNCRYGTSTVLTFSDSDEGFASLRDYLDDPPPAYNKNPNVDEFIANTLISMGVKFDTTADALSYASDAWNWCIDEENMESANPFDEWNIDSFVSYCNAQSNNYLNWYNGYKVSKDVTNALGEYIRQNIRSLSGLTPGITSLTGAYLPIYHYGSGFQSGVSSPTAQTFYAAQTITYFNGEYVNETNDISTSQFLYTPPDVRRFLGYPGSSPTITPSSPTGTGTITDDPDNPDQKNITINFPALDWLADAIKSILDFLRNAFTTLANLLTQLLDAILGLFSDAFESLSEFGEGIIEWLYAIVAGFSTIGGNYIPTSLWSVILPFILINIGVGLIMFVMRSH